MPERQPYQGPARKLVLAFDVGTTYSRVSYSILDPGKPPVIFGVSRFPATDNIGGSSEIPSIVYYDMDGPRAFGCEATLESTIERAEDEAWVKLEWWKLHLRPGNMPNDHISDQDIPPLPPNRAATQVMADFLQYLFECTKTYIQETHESGRNLWTSFENDIDFVLSHPNGWGGPQPQIRRAAVLAGLVPNCPEGQARIHLVTEGEASLHYCLSTEKTTGSFEEDQGIMIIDASSGTIDISSYYITTSPLTSREIAPPECLLQGAVFVTRRANQYLREKLAGSRFGNPEDIAQMTSEFDKTTKLRFSNSDQPSYIRFGTIRHNDLAFNIKCGQLKIPGADVATLFEPTVTAIVAAVENQRKLATKPINSVFLVGAFATSDWLFARLQDYIKSLNLNFCRPDSYNSNKVVADGAIAFYLDHRVSARIARFTYGTRCAVEFNQNDEQHKLRAASVVPRPSGRMILPNAFSAILYKGTAVSEANEFRRDFITECTERTSCDTVAMEIVCYHGNSSSPRWTDSEPGMFSNLCTIHADTSQVSRTLSPRRGFPGLQFHRQKYSIVLMFGMTELQAQISWMENGEEKRGPATVVFDQIVEGI